MLSWYLLPGIVSSLSGSQDFYQKCGNTSEYGCFVDPAGCENTNNCSLGAVWRGTAVDVYEFEIISSSGDFVAVGFLDAGGSKMGDGPVIACAQEFSQPAIYLNNDYSSKLVFNHSEFVLSYKVEKGQNKSLSCSFSMNSTFFVAKSNTSGEQKFDLNDTPTYIAAALGPVKNGSFDHHKTTAVSQDLE